jgi:glycosyltransferase involved in cell wall biosynthesis
MPKFGIEPIVITADQGSHHINEKLNQDIPKEAKIYRLKSFFPDAQETYSKKTYLYSGNKSSLLKKSVRLIKDLFFSPDVQITWVWRHLSKISRIIKREKVNTVLITGAPFSLFVAGYYLKKRNKINLILDYRDCWQEDLGQKAQSQIRQYLNKVWENKVLNNTDAVIATTQKILDITCKNHQIPTCKVIPTGFDPQDFASQTDTETTNNDVFTFFYSGNFKPNTDVYDPQILLKTLAQISRPIKLIVCAHVLDEIKAEYTKKYPFIDFRGFIPRTDLFKLAQKADAFIHFYYPNKLKDTISFKLFEYSQYKKPIISINTQQSEVANFLISSNIGFSCENDNETEILNCFERVMNLEPKTFVNNIKINEIEKYNLNNTCNELCRIIKGFA